LKNFWKYFLFIVQLPVYCIIVFTQACSGNIDKVEKIINQLVEQLEQVS